MKLKRLFDWSAPRRSWPKNVTARHEPLVAPDGTVITEQITPPVRCVRLRTAPERQHFSQGMVEGAMAEGWLAITRDRIVISSEDGPVAYDIERRPGRYCCHCGEKLADDDHTNPASPGALARQHVEAEHKGKKSPDPENRSGYCCIRYYDCVKATAPAGGS